jgi:glycosyltransferase involved in cell wall biosynthesis
MKSLEEESTELSARAVHPSPLMGKRVVAVVYSSYPADPRPRRAAESLVKEGASVEVICLKETDEEHQRECFNGVDVTRVPLKHRRGGKLGYLLQYGSFILFSAAILSLRTLKCRIDLVHIHNMPDVLVFSALIPKLLGAKVILDLHDPMPELMMSIYGLRVDSFGVRVLKTLEKWSLRFADAGITVNEACRKIFSARSCPKEKITVIMNAPDEGIFQFRESATQVPSARDSSKPFVIMYHGSIVERHGLDLAVAALQKIRPLIPNAELRIYGRSNSFLEQVMGSVRNSDLEPSVRYLGSRKLEQIAQAIGECDVGIIPNRRSIFTELNTPTRIFEYLSQGKPVIAPRAPGILDYFSPHELILFELGDADDLATRIEYVFRHPVEMVGMVERGQEVYRTHTWRRECSRFVTLAKALLGNTERIRADAGGSRSEGLGSSK